MSLYLDDEQEKALREWWAWASLPTDAPGFLAYNHPRALHQAISPLMKRWWVDEACYLRGPGNVCAAFGMGHRAIAELVAHLLNEHHATP